jgi:hypothetical protein
MTKKRSIFPASLRACLPARSLAPLPPLRPHSADSRCHPHALRSFRPGSGPGSHAGGSNSSHHDDHNGHNGHNGHNDHNDPPPHQQQPISSAIVKNATDFATGRRANSSRTSQLAASPGRGLLGPPSVVPQEPAWIGRGFSCPALGPCSCCRRCRRWGGRHSHAPRPLRVNKKEQKKGKKKDPKHN